MKSDLKGPETQGRKYPYLGIFLKRGIVVLFASPESGTVVHDASSTWGVGHISNGWAESLFEPLKGTITLSN